MSSDGIKPANRAWITRGAASTGLAAPRFAQIIAAEDERTIAPMVWRPAGTVVAAATAANDAAAAKAAQPDITAQLQKMQQQCDQRVAEARAAGLREGEAAARARVTAEVQPVLDKMTRSISELTQVRAQLRKQAEGDTIKLSLAIARRVLRRELSMDPDAMRGIVMAALEKLEGQETCRVRAHTSQVAAITACLRQNPGNSKVEVLADGSLQPGGVVFETTQGNLDASVDSQLQEIERGLADHMRKNHD